MYIYIYDNVVCMYIISDPMMMMLCFYFELIINVMWL